MTVRIALVPPALTTGGRAGLIGSDEPLDEDGRQAAWAARSSGGLPSSSACRVAPLLQCRQTAELLGMTPVEDWALRDWDLGDWRGQHMSHIGSTREVDVKQWLSDPSAAPHGGESLLDLLARVGAWVKSLEYAKPRSMVVVTPPSVVRAALVHALECPPRMFWQLDVETLTVVRLTMRGGQASVRWRSLTG